MELKELKMKHLLLLAAVFLVSISTYASHFRHGTISWRVVSGNTVEFKISQAWRNGCRIGVGQQCYGDNLYFGDGGRQYFRVVATAVNNAENWYYGEATIRHTFASSGNYTAYFTGCCKISNLVNNSDAYWRNETVVNVGTGNEPPVTTMAPIINMQAGSAAATFQVPASDPDGDNLTYRLPTSSEVAGTGWALSNYDGQPAGFSVNSSTGLITFNTIGKPVGSLWNAAVVVEDGQTKVINDFIIKIVQQSNPPVFDYTVTPNNGSVIQVAPGVPVNFAVKADDTDPGATVSLQAIGVPPGASFTSTSSSGSASGTFTWLPSANNLGTNVINFLAQDNVGAQVSSSVTVQVSLKPQFDVPPTPAQGVHTVYNPGDLITYTVQASDPDPLDVVYFSGAMGKSMSGIPTPLYTNASFSNLNGTPANPTSGTFSWQTQASDWGHRHVYFYATDSYGDVTRHEISQLINTPPVFTSTPVDRADLGQPYSYTVQVSDADTPYGDAIAILAGSIPTWMSITDNGDGTATLSGTPGASDVGTTIVNIQAEDLSHHEDPRGTINQIFTLTVYACTVNASAQDVSITLGPSGSATVDASQVDNGSSATCGIASYSLSQTVFDCSDYGSNSVTLTVTDINGNTATANANVNVSTTPLTMSLASPTFVGGNNISCNGAADGSVDATVGGGCLPYSFAWSNGSTSEDVSSLAAGSYSVTMTDANGFSTSQSITLTEPTPLTGSIAASPQYTVNGQAAYTIYLGYSVQTINLSASAAGSTPGYSYAWSPATGLSSTSTANTDASPTAPTTYTVTITDANGCAITQSFFIDVIDARCGKKMDKVLVCHRESKTRKGVTTVNYHNICISANAVAAHLAHGDYLGACASTRIKADEEVADERNVVLFPNPNNGQFKVNLEGEYSDLVTVRVYSISGKLILDKQISSEMMQYDVNLDISDQAKGLYLMQIIDGDYNKSIKFNKF